MLVIDKETKCFICDMDKTTFGKNNVSFNNHRELEHNLWIYTYFLIYVITTDPDEMNGVDSYIYSKYKN